MPAALFMALSRSFVRASVTSTSVPADAIDHANQLICADSTDGMFVTLFYAQLDPTTGQMVYVNAGHNPPLLYRAKQEKLIKLTRTGMALGVFDGFVDISQSEAHMDLGDFLLLYTDGVTEAMDMDKREFGEERLRRILLNTRQASAERMAEALEEAVTNFTGAASPSDDITYLIVKRVS